jgi:hypothetical protein
MRRIFSLAEMRRACAGSDRRANRRDVRDRRNRGDCRECLSSSDIDRADGVCTRRQGGNDVNLSF